MSAPPRRPGEPGDGWRGRCHGALSLLPHTGAVYTMYQDYIKKTAQDTREK